MKKKKIFVPVIMYHTIGNPDNQWRHNKLTCPYQLFESQLKWLKNKHFQTISLQQLYEYMSKGTPIPKNSVVLTFDDGYLDNWVFAYPLLKKYGFSGTIYINPDFVDPTNTCRNTLIDVWENKTTLKDLTTAGFLSWPELKEMNTTGVMHVQSHTMTHTLYFKNDTIVDFRHPGDPYIWMTWNHHPDKKPFLQIDNEELITYGEPIYEYQKSLEGKRYFPDQKLSDYLITYVKKMGGKKFFVSSDWKNKLMDNVESYKKENEQTGTYETDEDYRKRIIYELKESKERIEKQLSSPVHFLCWPIGAATKQTVDISKEVGYISSTVGSDMKREKRRSKKNTYGEDPTRIYRIGAGLHRRGKKGYQYNNGLLFVLSLYDFQERKIKGKIGKILLTIITKI
jgi:hypothetical protein